MIKLKTVKLMTIGAVMATLIFSGQAMDGEQDTQFPMEGLTEKTAPVPPLADHLSQKKPGISASSVDPQQTSAASLSVRTHGHFEGSDDSNSFETVVTVFSVAVVAGALYYWRLDTAAPEVALRVIDNSTWVADKAFQLILPEGETLHSIVKSCPDGIMHVVDSLNATGVAAGVYDRFLENGTKLGNGVYLIARSAGETLVPGTSLRYWLVNCATNCTRQATDICCNFLGVIHRWFDPMVIDTGAYPPIAEFNVTC